MTAQTGKVSHTFAVIVTAPASMTPERVRALFDNVLDVGYDDTIGMRGTPGCVQFSDDTQALSIQVQRDPVTVYIVDRDSADGPETDVFLDYAIADRWAAEIDGEVREETTLDDRIDVLIETRLMGARS